MTMENYISYKKQIFLSVMRQNDIEDNIKDMNNLITEAHEELESNLQKTKQSMLDANKLVKESRQEFERVKQIVQQKEKKLSALSNKLMISNKQTEQVNKDISYIKGYLDLLRTYEAFIIMIKNQNEQRMPSDVDSASSDLENEDIDSEDFDINKMNPFLTNVKQKQTP